jgi:hypothetical protein
MMLPVPVSDLQIFFSLTGFSAGCDVPASWAEAGTAAAMARTASGATTRYILHSHLNLGLDGRKLIEIKLSA